MVGGAHGPPTRRLCSTAPNRLAVFRLLRENGPALLVPAAWLVVAATVLDAGQTAGILDATLRY